MRESETVYTKNIKNLEEELMNAVHSKSTIRVKTIDNEERLSIRYEEKIREKDDKI